MKPRYTEDVAAKEAGNQVCRAVGVGAMPLWSAVASDCSLHGFSAPRAKKPRRGGLSIEEPGDRTSFFLFFSGAGLDRLLNSPPVAPLKNKKKEGGVGGAAAINRPPLTGFEPTPLRRSSRPGVGPEESQVIHLRSGTSEARHRFGFDGTWRAWVSAAFRSAVAASLCRRTPHDCSVDHPAATS